MPSARYLDQPYLLSGRRVDPIAGTLRYREVQKRLRRKELEVLALLAEAGGEKVARSVFIEQVWQGNSIVGEQGLTDTISALRRSLLDTDRQSPLIQTIPRQGYQLRAGVLLISRDGGVAFEVGTVIDGRSDWRLKQLLEQTDAHESWLAEDGRSRRIFRFCRNEQQLRKLRREVVLMRYLREALAGCAHVSTILDWQLEEPPYFLELAAPACGNLSGVMLGKSVPELAERWRLLQEVAETLAAVHVVGVVHRNLSPDSVLVDRRDGERIALLGEFGLAALDDGERLTELGIDATSLSLKTGLVGPATAYTAPECVAGTSASAASDVYALGVLIAQTVRGDFQRLESSGFEDFPVQIAGLLQRCIAVDPATRPTAAELAESLRAWTDPKPAPRIAEPPIAVHAAPPARVDPQPVAAPEPVAATEREGAAPSPPARLLHQRIGRYRIISELAQGGMGVVYLAEQSEPVQRRVALKLIRAGLDSEQVLARFEAERQALAMMNHPNISAIFDAGTTTSGYPYFVMEFVPGKDIVSHCDAAKLSLRARIRLFLQVCDGVLHAHQKGLIHRDLKPSNIMVKHKSDQTALVKLIDFGVAKSLTGGLGSGLHTRVGSFIGTPVYSCPEQVIDPTRDIDTRADLYTLGVVLYEILVGLPPRSATELDADTPAELARRLRDIHMPAMGSRFTALSTDERQRIAELRTLSADALSMHLCSDLDWIVGKCIAQDPDDRYATVQDLRQDLQRWLADRPVEARPTSTWYRFRKMVRRNRFNAAISLMAGCALIVTSAAAVVGFIRAEREAAAAHAAAADAEQIAQFQQRQWEQINAETLGIRMRERLQLAVEAKATADSGMPETIERLLDRVNFTDIVIQQLRDDYFQPALQTIERDYADRPHLQHQLRQSIADSLLELGILDTAMETQELALRQREELLGPTAELTLQSLMHRGFIQMQAGETGPARMDVERAYHGFRSTLGDDHPSTAQASFYVVDSSQSEREITENYREILARRIASHGESDRFSLTVRIALAEQLRGRSEFPEALAQLRAVVAAGSNSELFVYYIRALRDIGEIARRTGDIAGAIDHFERALKSAKERYGKNHPVTIEVISPLVYALINAGRAVEAEALARRATNDWQAIYGDSNATTVWHKGNIAMAIWAQGRLDEAVQLMRECVEAIPPGHDDRFMTMIFYGRYLRDSGDLNLAREALEETAKFQAGPLKENVALSDLGRLEHIAGNLPIAEKLLGVAYQSLIEQLGQNSPITLSTARMLAGVWRNQGRTEDARQLLATTWPKQRPWEAPLTLRELAELELEQGNQAKAHQLAQQALEFGEKHMHPKSQEFMQLQETLVKAELSN